MNSFETTRRVLANLTHPSADGTTLKLIFQNFKYLFEAARIVQHVDLFFTSWFFYLNLKGIGKSFMAICFYLVLFMYAVCFFYS